MAALDGKIIIERELRPCVVTFCHIKIGSSKKGSGFISEKRKALFHTWVYDSVRFSEGHVKGNETSVFGIVELENGTLRKVPFQRIQFVDNAIKEYAFPEMENSNV